MKRIQSILIFSIILLGKSNAQLWEKVNGGCTGEVRSFFADSSDGLLYVAGAFQWAGNVQGRSVATWDGSNWGPIGGGTGDTLNAFWSPPILSIVRFQDDLFVGGTMGYMEGNRAIKFLSRWDGSQWNACGNPTSAAQLSVTDGRLFAMGGFDSIGGRPIKYLAQWDGLEWQPFGHPLQFSFGGRIGSSEFYKGEYYFAGNFNHPDGYKEIIRWDGANWRTVGSGVRNGSLIDIKVYRGQLFVGGEFHAGDGNPASYLMAWDGNQWYDPFPQVQYTTQVKDLEIINDELYIVGNHAVWDGTQFRGLYNLAKYDGQEFCSFGGDYLWTTSITGFKNELYVSTGHVINPFGDDSLFPNGRDTVNFIAKWIGGDSTDICISQPVRIQDPTWMQNATISLYPNPTNSSFTLNLPPNTTTCTLKIHDITGREVAPAHTYRAVDPPVDVAHLSAGLYFVEVRVKDRVEVVKLVKE